jgi:hypothetical protein
VSEAAQSNPQGAKTSSKGDLAAPADHHLLRCPDDAVTLLRARKDELMLSYLTLDELAGTQAGYTAKILGQSREKGLSLMTIFALAGAMGFAIAFVEDPDARRRYVDRAPRKRRLNGPPQMLNRLSTSQRAKVLDAISWPRLRRETLSEIGRKGGEQSARVRLDKIPEKRRKEIARLAARARWRKRR